MSEINFDRDIALLGDLNDISGMPEAGFMPIYEGNSDLYVLRAPVVADIGGLQNALDLKMNTADAYSKTVSDSRFAALSHSHAFASLTSKPNTLSGYNITDGVTHTEFQQGIAPLATSAGVDSSISIAIADLINSAPTTLDTLGEIAAELQADEGALSALTTVVGGKLAKGANLSDISSIPQAIIILGLDLRYAPLAHNQAWSTIISTPTTISGYGITDFNTVGDARYGRLSPGNIWAGVQVFQPNTGATTGVITSARFGVASTGTPAATFGVRTEYNLPSSTTAARPAAAIDVVWADATDASRSSAMIFSTVLNGVLAEAGRFNADKSLSVTSIRVAGVTAISSTGVFNAPNGTAAAPGHNFSATGNLGMYRDASTGVLGFSHSGSARALIDSPVGAGFTALSLYDVDSGVVRRVQVGAADSGGVNYRMLRMAN